MKRAAGQMALQLAADPFDLCRHDRYGYVTLGCVPAGFVCDDCKHFVLQWLPEPPEVLGYLSADWAWHHRDGKAWTTLPMALRPERASHPSAGS